MRELRDEQHLNRWKRSKVFQGKREKEHKFRSKNMRPFQRNGSAVLWAKESWKE